MASEFQKMLAGELYDPTDHELVMRRERARDLLQALNATRESEQDRRRQLAAQPGVRIGDRCVIGAGSVVTRDIPDGMFAAGNPCRVLRELHA